MYSNVNLCNFIHMFVIMNINWSSNLSSHRRSPLRPCGSSQERLPWPGRCGQTHGNSVLLHLVKWRMDGPGEFEAWSSMSTWTVYVLKKCLYIRIFHKILSIITARLSTYTFMQREKERQTHVHVRLCKYLRQKPGKYNACDGPNM